MKLVPEQDAKEFRRVGVMEAVMLMTQLELNLGREYALQATKTAQQSMSERCEEFCRRFHIHDRSTKRRCIAVAESEFWFINASYMVTRSVGDAHHD